MDKYTQTNEVIKDVAVLYELALASGQSLDLVQNCDYFLERLIRRKSLTYGAVWIKNQYLVETNRARGASLVYANPEFFPQRNSITMDDPIFTLLKEKDYLLATTKQQEFKRLIDERNVKGGVYAVFPLAEVGVLKLFSLNEDNSFFKEKGLRQIKKVIDKFALYLEGSLLHKQSLHQAVEREGLEKSLRKEIESQLRKSEQEKEAILNGMSDLLVYVNRELKITWVNEAVEDWFGEDIDHLCGRYCYEVWHYRKSACADCPVVKSFKTKEPCSGVISYSQGTIWLANSYPVKDNQGNVQGVIKVFNDITEQKKAQEKLQKNRKKIRKLHKIAKQMNEYQAEQDIYQLILDAAENILDFNISLISIKDGNKLIVQAVSSEIPIDFGDLLTDEGIPGQCFKDNKSYLVNDVWEQKMSIVRKQKYRATICVPIGELGVFQVISNQVGDFTEEDLKLAELLISHATAALNRINYEEQVRYMSFHDELTKLYNRNYFQQEVDNYDREAKLPLSIIIGDVNGLKLANDAFGHQVGDQLLIDIARAIESCCRDEDLVARWGGDEFIILLPNASQSVAEKVRFRIKERCAEMDFDLVKPSIALGYATKQDSKENINNIFVKAEDMMYKEKLNESEQARRTMLVSLKDILVTKTYESEDHCQCLKELGILLAKKMDLPDYKLKELALLAEFHDLGKVVIAKEIINKNDSLSSAEWEQVKRHSEVGYQIAKAAPNLQSISKLILSHHEWWDGSGYPQGLKEQDIPLLARIIAIVDAYDVMTSDRPYRSAFSQEKALNELVECSGIQFDPELVQLLIESLV